MTFERQAISFAATSSSRRRARVRHVAIRFAQRQSCDLRKLLDYGTRRALVLEEIISPCEAPEIPWCQLSNVPRVVFPDVVPACVFDSQLAATHLAERPSEMSEPRFAWNLDAEIFIPEVVPAFDVPGGPQVTVLDLGFFPVFAGLVVGLEGGPAQCLSSSGADGAAGSHDLSSGCDAVRQEVLPWSVAREAVSLEVLPFPEVVEGTPLQQDISQFGHLQQDISQYNPLLRDVLHASSVIATSVLPDIADPYCGASAVEAVPDSIVAEPVPDVQDVCRVEPEGFEDAVDFSVEVPSHAVVASGVAVLDLFRVQLVDFKSRCPGIRALSEYVSYWNHVGNCLPAIAVNMLSFFLASIQCALESLPMHSWDLYRCRGVLLALRRIASLPTATKANGQTHCFSYVHTSD